LEVLRHRHRAQTTQLARPASGIAASVLAALLVGAPAAHAAPAPDNQVPRCGDSLDNWTAQTLAGMQYHDNKTSGSKAPSTFAFPSNNGHRVNWDMSFPAHIGRKGTTDTDEYRSTEPGTIEFNSDLGTGKGDMWRFRLTAIACGWDGKVLSATANTFIPPFSAPPFLTPVTHYGTAYTKPLTLV
jgi:hypothetical protein